MSALNTSTVAAPAATTPGTDWKIDPVHSHAEFKVKHMMISNVKGEFKGIAGTLNLDNSDPTRSSVQVSIDAATISSGDAQRDGHLKSADFFNVEEFPTLTFKSTRVTKANGGALAVAGDLAIRGVSRNVVLQVEGPSAPMKDPWGNTRIGLSATTQISRKDFGLSWNAALETGGFLVGDDVKLTLDVQFIKA
jgi:polyisoprenoid-binding protein YceI